MTAAAAAAHHDFKARTLITTISGFSEMLADPALPITRERRLEYAEIIYASNLALQAEMEAFVAVVAETGRPTRKPRR